LAHPQGSFEDVFHQTYDSVLGYALRRLPGRAQADDVTAEVFTAAWQAWQKGKQVTPPWLLSVARNKIADHYRREARARDAHQVLAEHLADAETLSEEGRVGVWMALSQLGEREREALTLTYWDGLSGSEVAEALGCTQTTVWAVLSRARKRLRKLLEVPAEYHAGSKPEGGIDIDSLRR